MFIQLAPLCGDQNRQRLWPTGSDGVTCLHKWLFAQEIPFQPAKMASVREMLLACATTSRATTSRATPSRATPSRATPSRATPFQPAERSGCGTFRLRNVSGCGTFPAAGQASVHGTLSGRGKGAQAGRTGCWPPAVRGTTVALLIAIVLPEQPTRHKSPVVGVRVHVHCPVRASMQRWPCVPRDRRPPQQVCTNGPARRALTAGGHGGRASGSASLDRSRTSLAQRVPRLPPTRSTAAFQGRAPLHVFPYLFVHVRYYTDTGFALSLRNDPGPGAGSGPVA